MTPSDKRRRQNKANLNMGRLGRPSATSEALPLPPAARQSRQTKPIPRHEADPEIGGPRRQACETKPISGRGWA